MSVWLVTILMFLLMFVWMAIGVRLAFLLGGVGIIFIIWLWGPQALGTVVSSTWGIMNSLTLVALPFFIFMAMILEESGVAEDFFTMMHRWMGSLKGGLAMGTIIICTIFAAMSGVAAAAATTMGLIALPQMLKRGYDTKLAIGSILAGGALASIIPPSFLMVLYAVIAGESLGKLLMAGIVPGLILSSLFILYIGILCFLNPKLGPPLPHAERVDWRGKVVSLKGIILPALIVLAVLGSIFFGVATPTEASAVGVVGSIAAAGVNRRLSLRMIKNACLKTFSVNAMLIWVFFGATVFAMAYTALGATQFIKESISVLPVNPWVIIAGMMLSFFLFGMIMDDIAILMITAPIYIPIVKTLGFDPLWFGILYIMNMEMAMLSPPFGYSLFYMRAVAPSEITMGQIYLAGFPFVALQGLGLILVMIFPQLALWLPNLMIRAG